MFSLGATLAFAATGHAPYQGETVMDVLVRLATEPPDLAGLPAELTDRHRVPGPQPARSGPRRPRCSASSGPFVAGPAGPGSATPTCPRRRWP